MIANSDERDGRVVTVEDDGRVEVREPSGAVLQTWMGLWSPGGGRVCLASEGSIVVTGSWTGGVCGVDVVDGRERWRRSDLTHIQVVAPILGGQRPMVAVLREGKPSVVVNPLTGREIGRVSGRLGATAPGVLMTTTGKRLAFYDLPTWDAVRGGPRWQVSSDFSPRSLVVHGDVAYAGGAGVAAFSVVDGKLRWRWAPGSVVHSCARRPDGTLIVTHHDPQTGVAGVTVLGPDGEVVD